MRVKSGVHLIKWFVVAILMEVEHLLIELPTSGNGFRVNNEDFSAWDAAEKYSPHAFYLLRRAPSSTHSDFPLDFQKARCSLERLPLRLSTFAAILSKVGRVESSPEPPSH